MELHSFNNTLILQLFLLVLTAALLLSWWVLLVDGHHIIAPPDLPPGQSSAISTSSSASSLSHLSSTYGPLMGLRLGSVRAVVASSPQMAKEILQTHDLTFCHRPRVAAAVHMFFNCGDIASSPDNGPVWKLMRQLCATELFTAKRLASFRHTREEEVRRMVRAVVEMGEEGKRAVELRRAVVAATNNIVCRMAMGKRVGEFRMGRGEQQDVVQSLVKELMRLLGVFYVGEPCLWWLDPYGYVKQMKATDSAGGDRGEKARKKKSRSVRITDDNIMGIILDLFTGGSDSSSITIEWALADLISNEQVMHKLRKEIDNLVGNERLITESDIENLPYLALVVKESMRLHLVAPLLIPHESCKECQIGEYKIPAKTRAYINTWAIGHDPLLWEMPLRFWLERFENKNFDLYGKNFELLPFGVGRRGCLGWALALLNVHLMLATLVQGLNFFLGTFNDQDQ
ncbi:hypothetical protein GOP47_0013773 [Adiantum capillus-veneris]|uniref:Cytochrome P450 n=1 Tax=Adiantum capillus-veneris TaxID=13818 RepID=A0A9D4UPM7_ADICA|nr:hypothetical protein GOP47_0013773 [Adiantum capillus-veneris]